MKVLYYESTCGDACINLAIEEYLFHLCSKTDMISLYLWQNENAVIIGRGQNVYTECNIEYCNNQDVQIIRRMTGGGAVYHDLGNLNFSMIFPRRFEDKKRSTGVIIKALKVLKLNPEVSGRNDIMIGNKKISGNAYYSNDASFLHHGTLLLKLNDERMRNSLVVSKLKLEHNGVKSVVSRCGDIYTYNKNVSAESLKMELKRAFQNEYGVDFEMAKIDEQDIMEYVKKYSSKEWNLEKIKTYKVSLSDRFDWGELTICADYDKNMLLKVEFVTDSMDIDFFDILKSCLNSEINKKNGIIDETFFISYSKKWPQFSQEISDVKNMFFLLLKGVPNECV